MFYSMSRCKFQTEHHYALFCEAPQRSGGYNQAQILVR